MRHYEKSRDNMRHHEILRDIDAMGQYETLLDNRRHDETL